MLRNNGLFLRVFLRKMAVTPGVRAGHGWPPYCVMEATKESVMRDKFTVRTLRTVTALLPIALLAPIAGCGNNNDSGALPPDVKAIVFLQRMPRGDQGNVFDYQSYAGGGRLVQLKPPSADGTPTTLFPTAQTCADLGLEASCVNAVDIMSYDINFNADTIVLSAKMSAGEP